jgi:plastocyanin
VASQDKGVWTQTSVTLQPTVGKKAVGSATEIADEKNHAIPNVNTALAPDAQGHHHVAWATPKGLFYSTDAGGSYGEAEAVSTAPAYGASITVGEDGTPWISYYAAGALKVAHKGEGGWTSETAVPNLAPLGQPAMTTAIGLSASQLLVAYDQQGVTALVRLPSGASIQGVVHWTTEKVPGDGGLGVSLAIDADGNPHVAYYDSQGNVRHAHTLGGAPWEVTDLGSVGAGPSGQPDPGWSTGIALDGKGVHYVTWADTKAKKLVFATNSSGEFQSSPVPGSELGVNPSIAASADGKTVAIAWFDNNNSNLNVAQTAGGLALAHPTTRPPLPTGVPTSGETCEPDGTALQITAPVGAQASGFDKTCLAVPAGEEFTVEFTNNDQTIHDFAIFTDSSATTRLGGAPSASDLVPAGELTTYRVNALDPGTYYFHCDVHPTTMTGTFIVSK